MAKFTDVNTIGTGAAAIFKLKAVLKAAGWTVPRLSDGTTYNASGDQITLATAGAGGMANASAWFVAQEPGGRREWCFQRISNVSWRAKYSALSKFTGGSPSATRVPSATDEQVISGAGSDASPTGTTIFTTDSTYRVHIVANSTAIGGVYPFVLFCTLTPGITVSAGMIAQEPMAPGSYDAADADPCVVQCINSFGGAFSGWLAYGTGSQTWAASCTANVGVFLGTLPVDLVNGKDVNGRIHYTASSGGVRSKGLGATLGARGPARLYPTTGNRTTDAHVYMLSLVLPYPDNTEPGA